MRVLYIRLVAVSLFPGSWNWFMSSARITARFSWRRTIWWRGSRFHSHNIIMRWNLSSFVTLMNKGHFSFQVTITEYKIVFNYCIIAVLSFSRFYKEHVQYTYKHFLSKIKMKSLSPFCLLSSSLDLCVYPCVSKTWDEEQRQPGQSPCSSVNRTNMVSCTDNTCCMYKALM